MTKTSTRSVAPPGEEDEALETAAEPLAPGTAKDLLPVPAADEAPAVDWWPRLSCFTACDAFFASLCWRLTEAGFSSSLLSSESSLSLSLLSSEEEESSFFGEAADLVFDDLSAAGDTGAAEAAG